MYWKIRTVNGVPQEAGESGVADAREGFTQPDGHIHGRDDDGIKKLDSTWFNRPFTGEPIRWSLQLLGSSGYIWTGANQGGDRNSLDSDAGANGRK